MTALRNIGNSKNPTQEKKLKSFKLKFFVRTILSRGALVKQFRPVAREKEEFAPLNESEFIASLEALLYEKFEPGIKKNFSQSDLPSQLKTFLLLL